MRIFSTQTLAGCYLVGDHRRELWIVPIELGGWDQRRLYALPVSSERTASLREQPTSAATGQDDLRIPPESLEPRSVSQVVGSRIKAARRRADMTQGDLSEQLPGNLYRQDMSQWERGVQGTSIPTLYRLAWALGCDVRELI